MGVSVTVGVGLGGVAEVGEIMGESVIVGEGGGVVVDEGEIIPGGAFTSPAQAASTISKTAVSANFKLFDGNSIITPGTKLLFGEESHLHNFIIHTSLSIGLSFVFQASKNNAALAIILKQLLKIYAIRATEFSQAFHTFFLAFSQLLVLGFTLSKPCIKSILCMGYPIKSNAKGSSYYPGNALKREKT